MFGYSGSKYSRGSRSYYSGRYRRFGSRWYGKRGTVARARASGWSAQKGIKTETANVTTQGYFEFSYGVTNPPYSNVIVFHPYAGAVDPATGTIDDATLPIHGGAVNDRAFRLKCSQYDEVRLDSMRVYINPVVSASSSTTPTMTISTIWDRKATVKECGDPSNYATITDGRLPTPEEIMSNEGAIKSVTNMNSTRGISRSCYANNMQEKSYYWDSTIHYNTTAEESPLSVMYLDAWAKREGAFCPALFVVSQLNLTSPFGANYTCSYRVEYNFTFRNPKSEVTDFIIKEDPTYTNPIGDAKRALEGSLIFQDWLRAYRAEKKKARELMTGTRVVDVEMADKKEEEDVLKKVIEEAKMDE